MSLNLSNASPTDILVSAMEDVDGADFVVILIEKEGKTYLKGNSGPRDIHWLLEQGKALLSMYFFKVGDGE